MGLDERTLGRLLAMDSRQPPMHVSAIGFSQAGQVGQFPQESRHCPQSALLEILGDGLESHDCRYSFRKQYL
jgi:hypothetical protein